MVLVVFRKEYQIVLCLWLLIIYDAVLLCMDYVIAAAYLNVLEMHSNFSAVRLL